MSRPLRIEYPGAWYHLMNRGRRKEAIVANNGDRAMFLALLQEAALLWNVRVAAFCLMDNHYHILAQTPQGNLSRFMRHFNGVYTQRFNRRHGYDGQLFRGRYKSILVDEDAYLLELVRYIHNNPLRAGYVTASKQYRWSSSLGYLSEDGQWDWLFKETILSMLTQDPEHQLAAYLEFMGEDEDENILTILGRAKWPSLLGGEDFINWVKQNFYSRKQGHQVPEVRRLAPSEDRIIQEVCHSFGVDRASLLCVRRGKTNDARDAALYLCRVLRNDTLKRLGAAFGMSGYSPAGRAVDRFRKKLQEHRKLRYRVGSLEESILQQNSKNILK